MTRILATLTAATALIGIGVGAPASAQTIVTGPLDAVGTVVAAPFVAAADLGDAIVGLPAPVAYRTTAGYGYYRDGYGYWGVPVGTNYGGEPVPAYEAAAPAHGAITPPVYGLANTCHYAHERIGGMWRRVRICR
jgi:hypothetical protein